ncbi:MAG: Glyoxalase/bleomycin resistance protein/dioxygenase [Myxococcales bacterium]|nr:Glyoxalase/bleomycin resistance protein/dioxygenase [Myxococcales bacterium]
MRVLAIDHVQLAIPPGGEAAARAFYIGVLGFTEIPKPEAMRARGGMWLAHGPVAIHLGIEPDMRPSVKMHPALVVSELEEWRVRLVAAGCEWKPADDVPGTNRAHTKDPFGNRIELIEAPK